MSLLKRILTNLHRNGNAAPRIADRTRQERWRAALALLDAGRSAEALEQFALLDSEKGRDPTRLGAYRYGFMDEALASRREAYVGTLDDVKVETAYWIVMQGDRLYHREAHGRELANSPLSMGRVDGAGSMAILSVPEPSLEIAEPCILLGGDDNYAHWLLRNLLKLSLLEGRDDLRGLRFLINADLFDYQTGFLELLGIAKDRLIPVPRGIVVHCRRLHVPTILRMHPQIAGGVRWLREQVRSHMAAPEDANDLLYVARRDARWRHVLNEEEIIGALTARGARCIDAGRLPVGEQIVAFSRARTIVTAHGAGLANQIFAPDDAGIVEIGSTRVVEMGDFRHIAIKLGQRIETVRSDDFGPCAPGQEASVNRNYRVAVADILAALDRVDRPRPALSR
jgi:hypothetical protein